ncbi:MAG: DUF3276 family protein [Bacteroidota bacterium]|nr:DUF3276 family protein [Bacteroidota bacterium]
MEQKNFSRELYTKCVHAGRRRYYIDVKAMRSGKDCYITITESRPARPEVDRVEESKFEKTKIFLFREDFDKFMYFLDETIGWVNKNFAEEQTVPLPEEKTAEVVPEPSEGDFLEEESLGQSV